jgi:hypothetical protein
VDHPDILSEQLIGGTLDVDGELENPGADFGRQRLPRLPVAIAMHQSG